MAPASAAASRRANVSSIVKLAFMSRNVFGGLLNPRRAESNPEMELAAGLRRPPVNQTQ
jgi:hypothetical protein